MSDLMKAFCGVAETPYGFAGDAGIDAAYAARRAAIAAWEEFVESDSPATQLPRDMWDWDSESQEGISDCDVRRFADRVERGLQSLQQERWGAFLKAFRAFASDMEVVRGNVVFEAIVAGDRRGAGKRNVSLFDEMWADLVESHAKGEILTLEWVEDFFDDYS